MTNRAPLGKRLADCQRVIGYYFSQPKLLETALTHSSLRAPDRECNERLEFLGDSVLGLVVTEELYHLLPDQSEGELTRIKSAVVSRKALLSTSQRLDLPRFADFARGVGKRDSLPPSVVANLVEAVIGAIYLDAGYYPAREFVLRHLGGELEKELSDRGAKNYKSLLQHEVQQAANVTPNYRTVEEEGPDHRKSFTVVAMIRDKEWGRANGNTKKEAEQDAARLALEAWTRRGRSRRGPASEASEAFEISETPVLEAAAKLRTERATPAVPETDVEAVVAATPAAATDAPPRASEESALSDDFAANLGDDEPPRRRRARRRRKGSADRERAQPAGAAAEAPKPQAAEQAEPVQDAAPERGDNRSSEPRAPRRGPSASQASTHEELCAIQAKRTPRRRRRLRGDDEPDRPRRRPAPRARDEQSAPPSRDASSKAPAPRPAPAPEPAPKAEPAPREPTPVSDAFATGIFAEESPAKRRAPRRTRKPAEPASDSPTSDAPPPAAKRASKPSSAEQATASAPVEKPSTPPAEDGYSTGLFDGGASSPTSSQPASGAAKKVRLRKRKKAAPKTTAEAGTEAAPAERRAKKTPAKKASPKKSAAKRSAAKKAPAERAPAKKRAAKKSAAKKSAPKKAAAKKSAAKKAPAKKAAKKRARKKPAQDDGFASGIL